MTKFLIFFFYLRYKLLHKWLSDMESRVESCNGPTVANVRDKLEMDLGTEIQLKQLEKSALIELGKDVADSYHDTEESIANKILNVQLGWGNLQTLVETRGDRLNQLDQVRNPNLNSFLKQIFKSLTFFSAR